MALSITTPNSWLEAQISDSDCLEVDHTAVTPKCILPRFGCRPMRNICLPPSPTHINIAVSPVPRCLLDWIMFDWSVSINSGMHMPRGTRVVANVDFHNSGFYGRHDLSADGKRAIGPAWMLGCYFSSIRHPEFQYCRSWTLRQAR